MHWRALDGLRGLSAQVVFICHIIVLGVPAFRMAPTFGWLAQVAVIIFFVLSGFVIASSIERSRQLHGFDPLDYGMRRAARIYPPYVAAIVIVGIVSYAVKTNILAIHGAEAMSAGSASWARAVVFLFRGNDAMCEFDAPLWSLRLEVVSYAIAGLIACALAARVPNAALAAFYFAAALLLAVVGVAVLTRGFLGLSTFAIGGMAAIVGRDNKFATAGFAGAVLLIVIGIPLSILDYRSVGATHLSAATAFQLALAFFVALWIAGLTHDRTPGFVGLQACAPLARFAYTLYVVHFPVVLAAPSIAAHYRMSTTVLVLSSVVSIELVAFVLALFVERPDFYFARFELAYRAAVPWLAGRAPLSRGD